jgi:ABC exporter DevB family membrane fusion protein
MNVMEILRTRGRTMVAAVALAGCALLVGRHVTAKPVNEPIARDVQRAARDARPSEGTGAAHASSGSTVGGYGVVEPRGGEIDVAARMGGVIDRVWVKVGEHVTKGQVLVELESGEERAAVAVAEAEVAAARAELTRTLAGLRAEDRAALAADVDAAQARYALAQSTRDRTADLVARGAVTATELERAETDLRSSQAAVQSAEARVRGAAAGRAEDVSGTQARLRAAQARLDQAKAVVDRLVIRAPIEGDVLQVKVRAGEGYSPKDALLVMGDLTALYVRMDVDERDVARIALGQRVTIRADAWKQPYGGKVVELGRRFGRQNVRTDDPIQRNDTKILEVLVELDPGAPFFSGQRVDCFVESTTSTTN